MIEQLLRVKRGGAEFRPFCREAQIKHRGYSLRLQRVLTDFGSEVSFGQAVSRVKEHYAVEVPVAAVRQHTLRHGKAIPTLATAEAAKPATQIITQMDGSMIPVMQPGSGADARQGRSLFWREVRLCCARPAGQTTALYGATLGSAETASWLWRATAQSAGLGDKTQVHGVGDGAHVSEYLAAAAEVIQPKNPKGWRQRQQGRLLENKVTSVLRAMESHLETVAAENQPVNAAYQYLSKRRQQLDYAAARSAGLPIGSGEIESGHRHVIQQRLKLAGCWWKETHAQAMLNLRVARSNNLWNSYWSKN